MERIYLFIVLLAVCVQKGDLSRVPDNVTRSDPCTDENHIFLAPGVLTSGGTNRACVSRFHADGPARVSLTLYTEDQQTVTAFRELPPDENHIFLAPVSSHPEVPTGPACPGRYQPGLRVPGGTNRACVSRFHADGPARVSLTLYTEDQKTVTAFRELPPGDGGCIDIGVPQLPNTKAELIINVRYPESQCSWERRTTLRVGSGRVVAVHSESARYRPGEELRVRVLALKPDLTPAHGQIDEIWLEGPRGAWEGTRTAEWRRVRTRLGVAQVQHSLDEMAPPGRWTVRARLADGSQGSSAFWVGNYELPPFQLSVRHAPRVLRTSERLVWTVCVRYPWTEAVEGMLVIRIRGAGAGSDSSPGIRTAVRLRTPRACHRHAAAARRIGLDGNNPPDVVVADFSFQEEGTRIWQNTTVVSQVVDKPITLEFLTKHRALISPGLPYKLKVKAIRWDEKPSSDTHVRVCKSPAQATTAGGECNDAYTDESGVARVMFTAGDDDTAMYKFEATLHNDTSISAPPLFLQVQRTGSVHAALGPLKADPNYAARTFVPLYLNLANVSNAITVHFAVITRGGIIYRWGATTQCPVANSADQIQTAPRNSPCPRLYGNRLEGNLEGNTSDALLDRHLLRIMLPIKVTHQMCPDSHLVAYFYLNGELVSASKHFEMEECFANKVEATWSSRQTPPGSTISLQLSTPGPALCALTALDSAAKWVQPGPTVKDLVLGGLRRLIDGHRNLTEYDAAGECFLTSDSQDLPTASTELTAAWLAAAGVRIVGGNTPRSRSCPSIPMPLIADEATVPRSDFSEAWLWRLVPVGGNGTAWTSAQAPDSISRYEASAVCVSRTGIAVSPPAVLQVFREFFIHADSPRRLRRGDSTIIRYRLFNYLYEPLSIQIQILTDPHLEGPTDIVESTCIAARSSIARRVEVQARVPGNARVSVRAKSVKDGSCVNMTTSKSGVSDEVIIQMTVDPEGVPMQDHKSLLLCGRGSMESRDSEVMWTWPAVNAVPGTESLTVWAIGDISGPLLADADDLVLLPRGCGEQNMARMATNLLALKQLDPHSSAAASAREHVARGFTRQLQYIHPAGGFSAFGASDAVPSTWLTAFTVRYLRKAHETLTPGLPAPPALDRAEQWLLSQQMENGCFRNEGQVFHRELRGGLNEEGEIASIALTAYVITSLVESAILPSRVLRNAFSCLRALPPLKSKSPVRVYAHSLLAYAFMRLKRYEDEVKGENEAGLWEKWDGKAGGLEQDEEMRELVELLKMARRSGDFVWWETGNLATSIEATGYALLTLSGCPPDLRDSNCAHDAQAAIRWLSTHRNAAGGFVATQDTLVALEALIAWSSVHPTPAASLNVTARGSGTVKTVTLQPGVKVPDVMKMGAGDMVRVDVEGTGCALVQATRSYNALTSDASQDNALSVEVAVHTDGAFDCDVNGTNCFCAAVIEACVIWSGDFPEMALLEVSLPGGFGADASLLYAQLQLPNTLLRRIELSPSSSKATLYLAPRGAAPPRAGHGCFRLHAVGPQTRTKPAHARVQDYYKPHVNDTQMYTIPEECPPRIIHETNRYLTSDNLFNKAKSLIDSNEIVITNEFSFEDIPEGIPLEDPLYDNLTQGNVTKYGDDKIEELVENTDNVKSRADDKVAKVADKENCIHKTNDAVEGNRVSDRNNLELKNIKPHKIADKLARFDDSKEIPEREGKSVQEDTISEKVEADNEIPKSENLRTQAQFLTSANPVESTKGNIEQETKVQDKEVENPNLAGFHVIDSEKDLEVPQGMEGPVPVIMMPPPTLFQARRYMNPTGNPRSPPWERHQIFENPRTFQPYRPPYQHQTYFYQPTMENAYINKFRYNR